MYPRPQVLDPTLHSQEVLEIKQKLLERTIGQPQVVDQFARILETFKAGYNDPKRPVGVVLELGPTGTGKTRCPRPADPKTPRAHAAGNCSGSDLICPAAESSLPAVLSSADPEQPARPPEGIPALRCTPDRSFAVPLPANQARLQ